MIIHSRRAFALVVILLTAFVLVLAPSALAFPQGTITSSLNPSLFGQSVTFTWSATAFCASSTKAPASFSIGFYDGQTLLGNIAWTSDCAAGTMSASYTTSSLSIGSHRISAIDPASGPSLNQMVNGAQEVPESDTLLLFGGGIGGLGVWLRYQ